MESRTSKGCVKPNRKVNITVLYYISDAEVFNKKLKHLTQMYIRNTTIVGLTKKNNNTLGYKYIKKLQVEQSLKVHLLVLSIYMLCS